jgi:ankyrin repeat protein
VKITIDSYDEHGFALVHYLAHVNYFEAIKLIFQHGANLNIKTKHSEEYPLLIASAKGYEQTVQVLIQCGS